MNMIRIIFIFVRKLFTYSLAMCRINERFMEVLMGKLIWNVRNNFSSSQLFLGLGLFIKYERKLHGESYNRKMWASSKRKRRERQRASNLSLFLCLSLSILCYYCYRPSIPTSWRKKENEIFWPFWTRKQN